MCVFFWKGGQLIDDEHSWGFLKTLAHLNDRSEILFIDLKKESKRYMPESLVDPMNVLRGLHAFKRTRKLICNTFR